MASRARLSLALLLCVSGSASFGAHGCTCAKSAAPGGAVADAGEGAGQGAGEEGGGASSQRLAVDAGGLSAPIAAARTDKGDVVVAGLDAPAAAIRVQRINAKDEVVADQTVLGGVGWSSEAELKVVPAEGGGVAITWRGRRSGKLVRQLLVLGADLVAKGEATEVSAGSCATLDALWFTDGKHVTVRPWAGAAAPADLPRDKDASLVCGAHRAYALLDEDEGTSLLVLGAGGGALPFLREGDFGDDEQRERAEFTVGDDLGVVRLSASGALSLRELKAGASAPGPLRRLKATIGREDDVVAVDASPRTIAIVFTQEAPEACGKGGSGTATRVKVLRVDRATFEETVIDLAPGACGREVGPFFTGAVADSVSVGWVERLPVAGRARAPISALAHRVVAPSGPLGELGRVELGADALVDAGCDGTRCYAVALARREGTDGMVPGVARVLGY